MATVCDHTSVGMLVRKDDMLLLIERARFPFGFSIPAGHVDDDASFEKAAMRQVQEEVGLDATGLTLVAEGRKENVCRRENGTWHYWKLYAVHAEGEMKGSIEETKQAGWYSKAEIGRLAQKTEAYQNGEVTEEQWKQNPGIVPVMYEWFVTLKII